MSGLDAGSVAFILFGLGVVLIANLSRASMWRLSVLIVASLCFIFAIEPHMIRLLPLVGFLACGYVAIQAARRGLPHIVTIAVVVLIGAYAWLKQYSFLPHQSFLTFPYVTLGLSYIFFRVLHLVIDAREPAMERGIGPWHYLAYTLNFTTFISGPIQRFGDFREQVDVEAVRPNLDTIGNAIARIVIGFFKINVMALVFSMMQAGAITELNDSTSLAMKAGAVLRLVAVYPLFLYCNFSGYIEIVIALARLMGLVLPENFNRPFSAPSLIEFWNRWHITLSTWLKTYVYNPLLIALLRRVANPVFEQPFGILCFFVTFFLIGLWHGRTSEFFMFGLLQGGGMAINKLWQVTLIRRLGRKRYRALAAMRWYVMSARGLTFGWYAFSLIWFWATWSQIHVIYTGAGPMAWAAALLALWLVPTVALEVWEILRARLLMLSLSGVQLLGHPYVRTMFVTILAATALLLVAVRSQPAPGIVYRTF